MYPLQFEIFMYTTVIEYDRELCSSKKADVIYSIISDSTIISKSAHSEIRLDSNLTTISSVFQSNIPQGPHYII